MLIPLSTMRTPVAIEPSLGSTGDGTSYGPAYTLKGSVNRARRIIRTSTGDTITAEATLLLRPATAIKNGDRVSEGGDTWIVEKVAEVPGPGGRVLAVEVMLR